MRQLDIGVDCDGVMYDFTSSLRHYLVTHEGYDPERLKGGDTEDPNATWAFYKDCWDMTTEEFLAACEAGVDAGVVFLHGEPFEHTVETLNRFKADGHRLHIITNRYFGTRSHHNTSEWLTRHQVPFDSLVFSAHKTIIRPDIMLDDYLDNQRAFLDVGVHCCLYNRPWNSGVHAPYRVDSWEEFEHKVQAMAVDG